MKVKDLMSRNAISAGPSAPYRKIWRIIFEKGVSGIPIVDNKNTLLGIISEEDLIEKLYPSYEDYILDPSSYDLADLEGSVKKASKFKASEIMSRNVYTTTEETPIMKAASTMLIHKVSCLPVVRETGKSKRVVGIICKGDIFGQMYRAASTKRVTKRNA